MARCAKCPNSWAKTARNSPSVSELTSPSPISRFFFGGEKQIENGEIIEHRRIDLWRQEHFVRPGCGRIVCELVQELKQFGLLLWSDFNRVMSAAVLYEENPFEHEHG